MQSSQRLMAILILAPMILIALLCGLLLGSEQWLLFAGLIGLGVALPLFLLGARGITDRKGWLLGGGWCVMLLSHGASKMGFPVGYVLEVVVFGLILASLRSVLSLAARDKTLRVLLILLVIQFGLAIASSAFGRSHKMAALWQLQYNLKWPLMFGLGTLILWTEDTERLLRNLLAWSWLFIVPFVILEIASISAHAKIFGFNSDGMANPFLGIGRRFRGPFAHAGYLAIICAPMAAGALVQWLLGRGRRWCCIASVYFALVLASGQRQESAALVFVLMLIFAIHWRRYFYPLMYLSVLSGAFLIVVAMYLNHVPMQSVLAEWGLFGYESTLSERAILTKNGLTVATQFYPLGSGLGTYGGVGALKFDQTLFWELGFGRYWWFRQGKFLVDTYWPCVVAESGVFGALLLFVLFFVLWCALLRRAWSAVGSQAYCAVAMALAAITILFANSPSSAVLTDPRGAFILWLIIGAAWRLTVPQKVEARARYKFRRPMRNLDAGSELEVSIAR